MNKTFFAFKFIEMEKETAFVTNISSSSSFSKPNTVDTFCNSSDSKALINRDNSADSAGPGCGLSS